MGFAWEEDVERPGRTVLYGGLIWLAAFAVSVLIYPLHETQRPLFESIMPVTLAIITAGLGVDLLRRLTGVGWRQGLIVGLVWFVINVAIDAPLFLVGGPMRMTAMDYIKDIGVTYLMIPIITLGLGIQATAHAGVRSR